MRIDLKNFFSLFLLFFSISSSGIQGFEIYVSPQGNDSAGGEFSNPVASLHHAAALARAKAGPLMPRCRLTILATALGMPLGMVKG